MRVANRAFNSQASVAPIDVISKATSDYGPYKEPSERVNEVLGGLTWRKGEGVSGRRRKLVKVKHLRPNESNEVEVSSKQWKRGKLRRKVLRPTNTEVKHNVKNGEGLSRVNRTRVLRRRGPSSLKSIDNNQENIVRVGSLHENSNRAMTVSEERESEKLFVSGQLQQHQEGGVRSGKYELVEGLGEQEGRKMVKGRGRVVITGKKTNGKGRKVTRGEGRNVIRGEGGKETRGEGRARKVVKRKKVGGRRFGGRRIDSGEKEKEKEEEGRVVMTGLRRKVRRKMRRGDRVENSGRKVAEASRKNSARQEASLKKNSFKNLGEASLKNLATQVKPKASITTISSPTTGMQQVRNFTNFHVTDKTRFICYLLNKCILTPKIGSTIFWLLQWSN